MHVLEQSIDTSAMQGRAMFGMLSVLAELQRELIVTNTNDGLASARARGRDGVGPQVTLRCQRFACRWCTGRNSRRSAIAHGPLPRVSVVAQQEPGLEWVLLGYASMPVRAPGYAVRQPHAVPLYSQLFPCTVTS